MFVCALAGQAIFEFWLAGRRFYSVVSGHHILISPFGALRSVRDAPENGSGDPPQTLK